MSQISHKNAEITLPESQDGNRNSGAGGETSVFGSSGKQVQSSILNIGWFSNSCFLGQFVWVYLGPSEITWKNNNLCWSRVTHVVIFILVGLSAFMSSILAKIPMPVFKKQFVGFWRSHSQVLYGVFLYMGINSLDGIQMWEVGPEASVEMFFLIQVRPNVAFWDAEEIPTGLPISSCNSHIKGKG